jgi:hypothetical protein
MRNILNKPVDTKLALALYVLVLVLGTIIIGERFFIHDTAFIKRTVVKFVLDSAWLQQYRDSLESANYLFDLARHDANVQASRADKAVASAKSVKEDLIFYRRIVFVGGGILAALIGAGVIIKLKKII